MGIAIAAAIRKASHTRAVDIAACQRRFWSTSIVHIAVTTRLGDGRNCGAITPARATSSQIATTSAAAAKLTANSVAGEARPRKAKRLPNKSLSPGGRTKRRSPPASRRPCSGSRRGRQPVEVGRLLRRHLVDRRIVDLVGRDKLCVGGAVRQVEIHHGVEDFMQRALFSRLAHVGEGFGERRVGRGCR